MITIILLAIFFLIARDARRTAQREAAGRIRNAEKGIVTIATIGIDDGDPW